MSSRVRSSFQSRTDRDLALQAVVADINQAFLKASDRSHYAYGGKVEVPSNGRYGVYVAFDNATSGDAQVLDQVMEAMAVKHGGRYEIIPSDENDRLSVDLMLDRRC